MPGRSLPDHFEVHTLPTGSEMVRVHESAYGPIWFGPTSVPMHRFDSTKGTYRIFYAAATLKGAIAETLLHGNSHRKGPKIVTKAEVEARSWSVITLERPVKLLKLYGNGLAIHGQDAGITSGNSYRTSRAFAEAAFAKYVDCDGLAFKSRHDNDELCFALFHRVAPAELTVEKTEHFKDNWAMTRRILNSYGAVLDPMRPLTPP
jgi:RES domain